MVEEVMKIKEVAEYFNVTPAVIRRMIKKDAIPYRRIRRQYRFQRSELEAWMRKQENRILGSVSI